ncbi:MAG: efflux RND transporter permease subunit, partial [Bryobacteraceae bacterium]
MPGFSIRNPYFIIVICLTLLVIGVTSVVRMPVDLFPPINLPEAVVATFYSGMPPEDIEFDITDPLERFFTLAAGVDHMESRSLLGVSIIKVYFQPGADIRLANAQITAISQTQLKQMPTGATPPLILNYSASTVPIIQLALSGSGLSEQTLADLGLNTVRTPLVTVPGAASPLPYGGKLREVQIDLDSAAMQA